MKTLLIERFLTMDWAMLPAALSARAQRILSVSENVVLEEKLPKRPKVDWYGQEIEQISFPSPDTAIVPIKGALVAKAMPMEKFLFRDTDYEDIAADLKTAADSKAETIFLDVDSPGGTVMGSDELMEQVEGLAKRKTVISVAHGVQASAAYKVAMPANQMLASQSSIIGSIGVIAAIATMEGMAEQFGLTFNVFASGKYKALGFPFKDMPKEHKEYMRQRVNDAGTRFRVQVGQYREDIAINDMQGQTFTGEEAAENGFIDNVGTIGEIMEILSLATA